MNPRRSGAYAQALSAGSSANYFAAPASPDPNGNRAQRRAWAKLTKTKMPPVSLSDSTEEAEQS